MKVSLHVPHAFEYALQLLGRRGSEGDPESPTGTLAAVVDFGARPVVCFRTSAGNTARVYEGGIVEIDSTRHACRTSGNVVGELLEFLEMQTSTPREDWTVATTVDSWAMGVPWHIAGVPRFRLEAQGWMERPVLDFYNEPHWTADQRRRAAALCIKLPMASRVM
jgi:hypothetical protein